MSPLQVNTAGSREQRSERDHEGEVALRALHDLRHVAGGELVQDDRQRAQRDYRDLNAALFPDVRNHHREHGDREHQGRKGEQSPDREVSAVHGSP